MSLPENPLLFGTVISKIGPPSQILIPISGDFDLHNSFSYEILFGHRCINCLTETWLNQSEPRCRSIHIITLLPIYYIQYSSMICDWKRFCFSHFTFLFLHWSKEVNANNAKCNISERQTRGLASFRTALLHIMKSSCSTAKCCKWSPQVSWRSAERRVTLWGVARL